MDLNLLDHKRDEENRKLRLSQKRKSISAPNLLALQKLILAEELAFVLDYNSSF